MEETDAARVVGTRDADRPGREEDWPVMERELAFTRHYGSATAGEIGARVGEENAHRPELIGAKTECIDSRK